MIRSTRERIQRFFAHKDPEPKTIDAGKQSQIRRELENIEQSTRHLRRFLGMEEDRS